MEKLKEKGVKKGRKKINKGKLNEKGERERE